jgi:hypothetical protein
LERRPDNVGNENAVQKFVSRLRAKLAALGVEDHVIACVYGGGLPLAPLRCGPVDPGRHRGDLPCR